MSIICVMLKRKLIIYQRLLHGQEKLSNNEKKKWYPKCRLLAKLKYERKSFKAKIKPT